MLRFSAIALCLLLALAGGWLLLACAMQRQALYPAPAAGGRSGFERIPGAERLWLETEDSRAEAWYLPPLSGDGGPAPLVVFTHGNAELIDDWPEAFEPPRRWGAAVLLVEYPGYGRSTGSPSQTSIAATMRSAFDQMAKRSEIDAARIIAYGRSLGGGAACALARERRVAALVLESTFTSVRSLARGFGVPGFLVLDPFDNLSALRAYSGPVLIVHGERDEIIPAAHAAELHAAAPQSRLALEPCGHNDCQRPWALLREFLLEHRLLESRNG
jgi:fermentation-respiration switch protein FrsA (DUF1100 family)